MCNNGHSLHRLSLHSNPKKQRESDCPYISKVRSKYRVFFKTTLQQYWKQGYLLKLIICLWAPGPVTLTSGTMLHI